MTQQSPLLLLLTLCVVIACLGCGERTFPDIEETTRQTYEEYKAENEHSLIDPIGASDISTCLAFEGDGYDEWWRFTVTQVDFTSIAAAIAETQNGPAQVEFSSDGSIPEDWEPDAEIPTWWTLPLERPVSCAYWCFSIGKGQRHHGWFLLHDPQLNEAYVWHWNHQWSSCGSVPGVWVEDMTQAPLRLQP